MLRKIFFFNSKEMSTLVLLGYFCFFTSQLSGQSNCLELTLDCNQFDITVCQRTTTEPNPPNCEGCAQVPIDCHTMQYVVRLSAEDGVTDNVNSNALCFNLSYTNLELRVLMNFLGAQSGMTRINKIATESTCLTNSLAVNEATNGVALSYGSGGTLPTITFTRGQTNAPFYAELFVIVVDVFPTDLFELSCDFFRYADLDNGNEITCFYPNTSTPPAPNYIAPLPFQINLEEDNNVWFMTDMPIINSTNATIPLYIRSVHMFPQAPLTLPYLDFVFNVESSAPIPPPVPLNAAAYEVTVSPSQGLNTFYTIKARLTGNALIFANSFGVLNLFDLYLERPNPQNMESTIELTYNTGRFEGQFLTFPPPPPTATFCKKMVKGGTGDRTVTFQGDAECVNSGLSLNIAGVAGLASGQCGELSAIVSLGMPNLSPIRELRFVLDFDMTAGAFIDEANIISDLPCVLSNNAQSCLDRVGTQQCYKVDGNTLTYCFKTSSGNEIAFSGGTMVIPISAISGCINKVTVREAAYYIVGQGTVTCVPNVTTTGFYLCSQEISGTVKSGPSSDTQCWVEAVDIEIIPIDNACPDVTESTKCPSFAGNFAPTPYAYCVCDEGNYTITPKKDDNPLNGVTTFDLVLISKHILGLEPFDNPYKMIAADANNSSSITTFDIVEFRKLILGTYNSLPSNPSWRFVPKELDFLNPANAFQVGFPDFITAKIDKTGIDYTYDYNSNTFHSTAADFAGIKMGDVNCSAIPCGNVSGTCAGCGTFPQRPANPNEHFALEIPGMSAKAGEVIILPVYAGSEDPLIAYQAGIRFDPTRFELMSFSAGDVVGFTPDCLNLSEIAEGKIKVLWLSFDHESNYLQPGQVLFYVALRAIAEVQARTQILTTDDAVFQNLGYTADHKELPLQAVQQPSNGQRGQDPSASLVATCAPNPTSGAVELSLVSELPAKARVAVFGPFGVRMYYRELELSKGINRLPIRETIDWPAGIYTWQVQVGKENVTDRFVKQ